MLTSFSMVSLLLLLGTVLVQTAPQASADSSYTTLSDFALSESLIVTTDVVLSDDHSGPIVIDSDGVTLDCAGHSVSGSFPDTGILAEGRLGVAIKNCHVTGFAAGIRLRGSYQSNLVANNLERNTDGVDLFSSGENNLINNVARENGIGFYLSGASANSLSNNVAEDNGPGFYLQSSAGNTLENNSARRNSAGYRLVDSSSNVLTDNEGVDNNTDYSLQFSDSNVLTGNSASGVADGFSLFRSKGNTLTGNVASNNDLAGFRVVASLDNTVTGNTIERNGVGVYVCKTVFQLNAFFPNMFRANHPALFLDKTC